MHANQAFYWMNVRFCLPMENDAMRVNDRTYAVGSNPGMCLNKRPDSPPAGRNRTSLFTHMLHIVQHVCEQDQNVPCCRRRGRPPSGQTSGLNVHRVSPVIYTRYAIADLKDNSASGRVEEPRSCSRNVGSKSQHFVNKIDHVPCCRRRNTPLSKANGPFECPPRNFCHLQELRGHEPEGECRLRQGGRFHAFAQKSYTSCNFFVQKKKVPCCRRRVEPFVQAHASFESDRVSRVN